MGVSDKAHLKIRVHVTLPEQGESTRRRENQIRRIVDWIESREGLMSSEADETAVVGRISELSVGKENRAMPAISTIKPAKSYEWFWFGPTVNRGVSKQGWAQAASKGFATEAD
jgi:hypothetical protein